MTEPDHVQNRPYSGPKKANYMEQSTKWIRQAEPLTLPLDQSQLGA